jgi:hypothetical protein
MRSIIISLIFIIFLLFAFFYSKNTFANGDEVHYLLATHSIVYDRDIWLENNYSQGTALVFNPGAVDKIAAKGLDGHLYPVHGIGYSFLLAPFYAFGKRLGTVIFAAFSSGILFYLSYLFSKKITKETNLSLILASAIFLNVPLFNFSVLNFTEAAGAFIIIFVLYSFLNKNWHFPVALALSFLPWIHIRYFSVALILYLLSILKIPKNQKYLGLFFPLSIICYLFFLKITFGSFNPFAPYAAFGSTPPTGYFFQYLISLFIDRQFGLFVYCPLFLFSVPGAFFWFRKNKRSFLLTLLIIIVYLFPIILIDARPGYTPPGRLLVPILPLLLPSLVYFFKERKHIIYKILAVAFYLWGALNMVIALLLPPNHGFVYGDGVAPSLQFLSTHLRLNIQSLFPAFYPNLEFTALHYVWIISIFIFWGFILCHSPFRLGGGRCWPEASKSIKRRKVRQ